MRKARVPEGLGYSLVHFIEGDVIDRIVRDARHYASHQRLGEFSGLYTLIAGILVDQKHDPP